MLALTRHSRQPSSKKRERFGMSLFDEVKMVLQECSDEQIKVLMNNESSLTNAMILTYIQKEDRARIMQSLPRPLLKEITKKMIHLNTLQPIVIEGICKGIIRKAALLPDM